MHRELVDALVQRDVDAVRRFYAVHGSDLATTIGNMLNSPESASKRCLGRSTPDREGRRNEHIALEMT